MAIGKSLKGKPKIPAKAETTKAEVKPTEAEIQKVKEKEHFKEVFDGIDRDVREGRKELNDRLYVFKRNKKTAEAAKAEPKVETTYAEAATVDAKAAVDGVKLVAESTPKVAKVVDGAKVEVSKTEVLKKI